MKSDRRGTGYLFFHLTLRIICYANSNSLREKCMTILVFVSNSCQQIEKVLGSRHVGRTSLRGGLWLNHGSCIRLRTEYKDHVWSYDLIVARAVEGRAFRILTIIDKYIRQYLIYSYPWTSCLSRCYRTAILSV